MADPAFIARASRLSFSERYLGPLRTLVRAIGSPGGVYRQIPSTIARFNKIGTFEVRRHQPGSVELVYRPKPDAPHEQEPLICRGRMENLAAIPTMFDLPPAEIEHPECIHHGSDACVYLIRHVQPEGRWFSRIALAVGGTGGLIGGFQLQASGWTTAGLVVFGGLALHGIARSLELRGEVRRTAAMVSEQQDALLRSTLANEARFAELLEAKTAVDLQVEERTAELRATSEQLKETLDEVQSLDRAKTDFFANVSHDLRTPLTLILSPLEALRRGESPPGGADAAFEAMHLASRRLLVLIDRLLDLAKADSGNERLELRSTDMRAFLSSLAQAFGPAATSRGVALDVDARVDVPLDVDPRWFDSALSNLVGNALRFAASRIVLRAHDAGGEITVEVEDDGPGIPEADRAVIFERFGQASEEARRRSGTGLGLAIVREAARLHGGRVTLEESSLGGARFVLQLPRRVASGPAVAPAHAEPHVEAPAPPADLSGPRADAPLALVAEDNPELRRFLSEVLATRFRVRATADGAEALAAARAEAPDVVVTDIAMPRMTGLELCRALRADPELRDLPIVMVTARSEPTEVLEGFDAGADDYVLKPFHGRELLARLDVQLRLRALARELAHKERLASLGILAASVAHHVRNPLTSLVSGLPAMRRRLHEKVDDRTREMLDVFIESAKRIEETTVDLLDLSRVDRQAEDDVRPGAGLGAAIRLLSARISTGVIIDQAIDLEPTLRGRPAELNHAFLNLIDNAAHAVGARGSIRVSGAREGDRYVVRIEDSGPGVPEARREDIFDYFTSTRGAGKGAGIGLAIVRDVAKRHGGDVRVDRSPDLGGARFTLELPLSPVEEGNALPRGAFRSERAP
ncbi:MAG: response regulator [Myxococcales bacterium]|nr:response regulator [Myxococcales bacterium]